ncbi:ABC transporter permease [Roseivirga sp. BDSF3-8]|uniref:ABC transporter permease n=1 Tax=Roseivirga sp. BDSF3-8 TaxID=3241598 RepID=UPI0035319FF8
MKQQEVVIRPTAGSNFFNFRELREYRDLLKFLIIRGIKAKYAQSVLGIAWAIILPVFTTGIFTVVFGKVAGIKTDGVPYTLFSFTTVVFWTYFNGALTDATNSLVVNYNMISKVYFPRIVLPLSAVISKLLDLAIGLLLLIPVFIIYNVQITTDFFLFPFIFLLLFLFTIGLGMILSALAINYRDVKHALTFMLQLLMYASPVVFPYSTVIEKVPQEYAVAFKYVYGLNPMVGILEGLRSVMIHTVPLRVELLAEAGIVSLLIFIIGVRYFNKSQFAFADVA